jgi:endonuclease G
MMDNENPNLLYEADSLNHFITYTGYVVNFNKEWKVPNYTIHRITPDQIKDSNGVKAVRMNDFEIDERLIGNSATDNDYYKSGFDRGHHVPAGDFVYSQYLKDETFNYSNVSPQLKELNRYGWKYLEMAIRKKVEKCSCSAYLVTGSIFEETINTVGENKVGVPNALYKIIFYPELGKMYAVKMGNNTLKFSGVFKDYQLTVDEIEQLTGYDFFERLADEDELKLESKIYKLRR